MVKSSATVVLHGALRCVCSNSRGMVAKRPPFVFRTVLQWCKPAVTDHMTDFTARWASTVRRRTATVTLLPNALHLRWVTAGSKLVMTSYRPFGFNVSLGSLIRTIKDFNDSFFCCEVSFPLGDQFFLVQLSATAVWLLGSNNCGKNKDW